MKKFYLALGCLAIGASLHAQSFSDDFESYTVGAYLGTSSSDWTTWSGASGGADDVQIVNDNAYSGTKSIYFNATSSGGGPDDVVLPFGGVYSTGSFNYSMMMYIETGKGGYFNFQAAGTVGQLWAFECAMDQNGDLEMTNTNGALLNGTVPIGQWFEISLEIDLNQNEWELFVDGVSQGSFSNSINAVASVDIFPYNAGTSGNGLSSFWVDDVSYSYSNTTLPLVNGALTAIAPISGLTGQTKRPVVTFRNLGQTTVTSFEVEVAYDGGSVTETVSGLSLASYDVYDLEFTSGITLVSGTNNLVATITEVNGTSGDDDNTDDEASIAITPIEPGLNKHVVTEEATGTWCGWCPRGAVWMDYMAEEYPDHFIGIAVHNGDPMVDDDYDAAIGGLISGYPSALVDRTGDIDPSNIEPNFMTQVVLDAAAALCVSASLNEDETELTVYLEVTPTAALTSDWKVAVALTEDNITGTASGYAQANYYSGGASGNLTGAGHDWHNEPNPVPAANMEYDHVARAIVPSFAGQSNSFPNGAAIGEADTFMFTIPVGSSWNLDNVHVIGMLINDLGVIDNGVQQTVDNALLEACGRPVSDTNTAVNDVIRVSETLKTWPNPASSDVTIRMNLHTDAQVVVRDMMGRTVFTGQITGETGVYDLQLNLDQINSGMYVVEVRQGAQLATSRFVKQ